MKIYSYLEIVLKLPCVVKQKTHFNLLKETDHLSIGVLLLYTQYYGCKS